ncbi:MAG TPA: acetylglutamate kinase [Kofleriaceae bacterium]|jgi:acetylglutamate kinase
MNRIVIKYGGAAMQSAALEAAFCEDVLALHARGDAPVVVHGGGPEINRMIERLGGGAPTFVDGLRVTSEADMSAIEMVLTGVVNPRLVTRLNAIAAGQRNARGNAIGVSGKDGATLRAHPIARTDGVDFKRAGDLAAVDPAYLEQLIAAKWIPVVSPIAIGIDGGSFNVNADVVAAGVARALHADSLLFLSDVAGILEGGALIHSITAPELRAKLAAGVVTGGMAVKARAMLDAIEFGVPMVKLVDGRVPHSAIEAGEWHGTTLHADRAP